MQDLYRLSAAQLRDRISKDHIKASAIASSIIERYEAVDDKIRGFAYFDSKQLLKRAEEIDAKDPKGPLAKIPIVIKDNICVKDEPTTCSSDMLKDFRPPYDATVVAKLKDAGALLSGKSNMDEFAFGSSCETSCYGPTRNPYDIERIPGGSSGGSAALVAADETILAIGSDTGGSIRQPAALCGVVGLKPTYGRVSRYGLIAFGSSLDQIGPITKDVTDCAILLNVLAGYDPLDSTSVDISVPDYTKYLREDIKGLRIGMPKEYFVQGLDRQVRQKIDDAIEVLKDLGAEFKEISLPHTEYAVSVYYIVGCSEASSNLARFDGVQYGLRKEAASTIEMYKATRAAGFGAEAKRRIILGTYTLSSGYYDAYYLKAQKVRTLIMKDFEEAFKECDIVITATSPTPAFRLNERLQDPLQMYLSDIYTIPANLAGLPAISIPCGYSQEGLPIGMQFMSKAFDEPTLIRLAYSYERNAGWQRQMPDL